MSDDLRLTMSELSGVSAFKKSLRDMVADLDIIPKLQLDVTTLPAFRIQTTRWEVPEVYRVKVPIPDVMRLSVVPPIQSSFAGINPPIDPDWAKLVAPGFDKIREQFAKRYPTNWPNGRVDLEFARDITEIEGIPLVYVPRAEIVSELLSEVDRETRVKILVNRTRDVLDDCTEALNGSVHEDLEPLRSLSLIAVDTLRSGSPQGAQAIAVNICDTLIGAHIGGNHTTARNSCRIDDIYNLFLHNQLRIRLGTAPLVRLLTEWHPKNPRPRPAELSRHVTVHQAHPDHYTPGNAILSVMIATGLLRALNEMFELVP